MLQDFWKENPNENVWAQLSERELNRSLLVSQLFLLILALILSQILFSDASWFTLMTQWDFKAVFIWGTLVGALVVGVQIFLSKILPKSWLEDDGLDVCLFRNKTTFSVLWITLCIAGIEEFLFRGVLQTRFGLWFALLIFVLAHTRYFKKMVLFVLLVFISLLLGLLFEWTNNLWAVMFAHFIIDFILVLYMQREERNKEGMA